MLHQLLRILLFICLVFTCRQASAQSENTWVWNRLGINESPPFTCHKEIKVAIIDNGFDLEHSLLKDHISRNDKEIPGNNIDDDHNGYIDDYEGWDFADNDNNANINASKYSTELHGSQITDIFYQAIHKLSGNGENYISFIPIKARSDYSNNNYITAGYKAMEYAILQHADIILCCWGGVMIEETQKKLLRKADSMGITIVATSGNYYFQQAQYPGAFDPVICVTATDKNNQKQEIANYGAHVDIAAPGDSILTINNQSATRSFYFSGTSAACPLIAAVVATLKATGYTGNAMDLDRLLKNASAPVETANPLYAGKLGAGIPDIAILKKLIAGNIYPTSYNIPKGYIAVKALETTNPVSIHANGVYKSYRLLLKARNKKQSSGAISLFSFRKGVRKQETIQVSQLLRPKEVEADSIQLFAQDKVIRSDDWIYYETVTIDSSFFFCSSTTTVKGTEGYIEDGSGNQEYTNRNDCKWLIQAPEGKRIRIEFTDFDIEAKKDQVYIFNGETTADMILAIFSGPDIPPVITTYTNKALIWFVTNESVKGKGWKLHYTTVDN